MTIWYPAPYAGDFLQDGDWLGLKNRKLGFVPIAKILKTKAAVQIDIPGTCFFMVGPPLPDE